MLPRWVAGFGYGVAFLLVLGGWTWFPLPLAVLWAMTAGVRLLLPTGNVGTESGLVVRTDAVPSTAR